MKILKLVILSGVMSLTLACEDKETVKEFVPQAAAGEVDANEQCVMPQTPELEVEETTDVEVQASSPHVFDTWLCAAQMVRTGYYLDVNDTNYLQAEGTDTIEFQATAQAGLYQGKALVPFAKLGPNDPYGPYALEFEVMKVDSETGRRFPTGYSQNKWNSEKPVLEGVATLLDQSECPERRDCGRVLAQSKFSSNNVTNPNSLRRDAEPANGRLLAMGIVQVPETVQALREITNPRVLSMKELGEIPFINTAVREDEIGVFNPYTVDFYCLSLYVNN